MAESVSNTEYHDRLMQIPQSVVRGECYEVKIENIYDPSKFWAILKFKELTIFMHYLKSFYNDVKNRKTIPRSEMKKNLICIVHRSGMYYRSVVLPIFLPDKSQVRVFMLDFGYIANVSVDDVFNIVEKHKNVPRFAIRACLAYISPTDQSNTWTQMDLKMFCELVKEKVIFAKICEIDTKRNVLFTELYLVPESPAESVNDMLVKLKLAVYGKINTNDVIQVTKYKSKVKYKHLFPSFEALESGIVPSSLWEKDLLKHNVPLDLLYKSYYEYQDID